MGVSKRLRFEIFRRDGHACRYCGATASDAKLTVDHVTPIALGGTDEPSNLVAACEDCNKGKSSANPDAPVVEDVAQDALRWAQAQQIAAARMLEQFDARSADHRAFKDRWNRWTRSGQTVELPDGWEHSVDNFMAASLPMAILLDCSDKAMSNDRVATENVFRYTCGVAWNLVAKLQKEARRLVDAPAEEQAAGAPDCKQDELAWLIYAHLDIAHDEEMHELASKTRAGYKDDEEPLPSLSDIEWTVLGAVAELVEKANVFEHALDSLLFQLPHEAHQELRRETIDELDTYMGPGWSYTDLLNNMARRLRIVGGQESAATAAYVHPAGDENPWAVG